MTIFTANFGFHKKGNSALDVACRPPIACKFQSSPPNSRSRWGWFFHWKLSWLIRRIHVNKQNYYFQGIENLRVIYEELLHPPKTTVWYDVYGGKVIGPYLFEDSVLNTVTVTDERINEMGLKTMWFQRVDATVHTAQKRVDILKEAFHCALISCIVNLHWPARFPYLTVPDLFLWGLWKSRIYMNKPQTLAALKEDIRQKVENLLLKVLRIVMKTAVKHAQMCTNFGGGHLIDITYLRCLIKKSRPLNKHKQKAE